MVAGELPDDTQLQAVVPGQRERPRPEFLRMRQIQRGGQGRLLAQLVGRQDLGDRDNFGPIGVEIGQRHRAVAGAEVDPETEASRHGSWRPDDLGADDWAGWAASQGVLFHLHLCGSYGGQRVGSAAQQLRQLHHTRLPATVDQHAGERRRSCDLADQPILVG